MPIASTISDFLIDRNIDYHVFPHDYTESSKESARATHIEPSRVAKAVVLATQSGTMRRYRVAVLPASRDIDVELLSELTRETMELAKEYELTILFPDCAVGAVPALGNAYGLQTIIDESIKDRWDDIFFEAGDHEELIRVSSDQFRRLMADARCAAFSYASTDTTRRH
ncbi:MAG: Ala-tRNA(Pro) deacylase [Gammaproteobacteria bacterium]|jgi:Ala-tRNA(Pro) deacylase